MVIFLFYGRHFGCCKILCMPEIYLELHLEGDIPGDLPGKVDTPSKNWLSFH